MTAADDFQNEAIRRQISLLRYAAGLRDRLIAILNKGDNEMIAALRLELERLGDITPQDFARRAVAIEELLNVVLSIRDDRWKQVIDELRAEMDAFAAHEGEWTASAIRRVLPVDGIPVVEVPAERIAAAVRSRPLQGRLMKDWAAGLATADRQRLSDSIRQGIIEGRTTDEMVRTIRGTRAAQYADGILQISRRNVESVARTMVNHVSNVARDDVFNANSDIVAGRKWVATPDGRTSDICRARDGKIVVGEGHELPEGFDRSQLLQPQNARPPAHWGCRSLMVVIFSLEHIADQIGDRPFVRDSRTRRQREKDFRAEAKAEAGEEWQSLDEKGRRALIKAKKLEWTKQNVGQVPAGTTYDEWLRKQPAKDQDEILGPSRAKMFREGAKLDKFVDSSGKTLTLQQLSDEHGLRA